MCGIGGIYIKKIANLRSFENDFKNFVLLTSRRGKDGTGIEIRNLTKDDKQLLKTDKKAEDFFKTKNYKKFIESNLNLEDSFLILFHCRLHTHGSMLDSLQPIRSNQYSLIHNGIISNYKTLRGSKVIQPDINMSDSQVFLDYLISKNKNLNEVYENINGSANIAFLDEENLSLATNTGDLFYSDRQDTFVFNSENYPIEKVFDLTPEQLKSNYSLRYSFLNNKILVEKLSLEKYYESNLIQIHDSNTNSNFLQYNTDRINSLKRCVKCILPETFPFITFDENGVCNFCNQHKNIRSHKSEVEKKIDFGSNVILALSGGRDSCYGLHKLVNDFGIKPITFTYDWGMITESARINIAKITSKLGVRNIVVGADTRNKKKYIRKNVLAWLKKPEIGMVPLFMAGDKHFFKYMKQVNKENNIDTEIWCSCPYESTFYRTGFTGVKPNFNSNTHLDDINTLGKLQLLWFYFKNTMKNPSYINDSLFDSITGFWSYYFSQNINQILLYKHIDWDEEIIDNTLSEKYEWELSSGFKTSWRSGDGTAAFYNYINLTLTGFTENDALRSNLIREGKMKRVDALKKIMIENEPNYEMIKWYLNAINLDFKSTINIINNTPKLYER